MKKYILYGILSIVGIYLLFVAFIPMMFGGKILEREIIQQSPQYVVSQRDAMFKLYKEYEQAKGGHKEVIKNQMCDIANRIPRSEWNHNQIEKICVY